MKTKEKLRTRKQRTQKSWDLNKVKRIYLFLGSERRTTSGEATSHDYDEISRNPASLNKPRTKKKNRTLSQVYSNVFTLYLLLPFFSICESLPIFPTLLPNFFFFLPPPNTENEKSLYRGGARADLGGKDEGDLD